MSATTLSRSAASSIASTALDAGLFALATLTFGGLALVAARWITGALGAIANFALNKRWAFAERSSPAKATRAQVAQGGRYALVALLSVSLGTGLWWLLHALTGADPRLLQLLTMAVVWLLFSYPLMRRWVFATSTSQAPQSSGGAGRSNSRVRPSEGTGAAPITKRQASTWGQLCHARWANRRARDPNVCLGLTSQIGARRSAPWSSR
jgi:putative flippase GtrA